MSKQIEEVMALVDSYVKASIEYDIHLDDVPLYDESMDLAREQLDKKRSAIESKLRELLPVWQPIESCLDDDWVIVWMPADEAQVIAQRSEGNWFGDDGLLHEDPTLWMPLQNGPAT